MATITRQLAYTTGVGAGASSPYRVYESYNPELQGPEYGLEYCMCSDRPTKRLDGLTTCLEAINRLVYDLNATNTDEEEQLFDILDDVLPLEERFVQN